MSKFFSQIQTTRKCKECGELVVLEEFNFVYNESNKRYIHYDCFVGSLTNRKNKPLEVEEAQKIANELKNDDGIRKMAEGLIGRNHLYKWLQKKYELVVMPSSIFTKFEDVFKGRYKGMDRGVPPEDLLDMWKRKWADLNNLYAWNLSKGKEFDPDGRIHYDLAVILAKTTSYYEWRENCKMTELKRKEIESENKNRIDYKKIKPKPVSIKNNEDFSFDDILDEI
jgi:hypothetical protein